MSEVIIELRDVCKSFGEHVVYDHMNLSIYAGETLTIIGGSGGGKSVFLKMLIGLLKPDSGQVLYRGTNVPDLDAAGLVGVRRHVAYLFQGGALFDSMDVLGNISYPLREHTQLGDAEMEERAAQCLDMVGMPPAVLRQMPASLSGGMKKRVALARSIAIEPEVILYDEPTTGLDPKNITRIGDLIAKLQRELHVTSIVVTHDMPMAHKASDRIALLMDRKFPYVGTADEMWKSPHQEVRDFIHGRIEATDGAA
jgi:phospholipid/cholesterol/gamma-HCH transport system ATP-binding protein